MFQKGLVLGITLVLAYWIGLYSLQARERFEDFRYSVLTLPKLQQPSNDQKPGFVLDTFIQQFSKLPKDTNVLFIANNYVPKMRLNYHTYPLMVRKIGPDQEYDATLFDVIVRIADDVSKAEFIKGEEWIDDN